MNSKLAQKALDTDFESLFKELGYKYFSRGFYNLNIIGIRAKGTVVNNSFDDILILDYYNCDGHIKQAFPITTQPGLYYMLHPLTDKGAAILVPGQHRGCWQIGRHQGKYQALVQFKPLPVYRDKDMDKVYDYIPETIEKGVFGINIHKAGTHSIQIDKWSAGCQVFANTIDFEKFMYACRQQIANGQGTTFSYTLLREEDLCAI